MDLLDFSENSLYFDEPLDQRAASLIEQAAAEYSNSDVEPLLLEAHRMAPEHLTVLVAMYRYYYYQHRLQDALNIAHQALDVSGGRLRFPSRWSQLTSAHLGAGAFISMGMVRFYLLALKAAGYLNLRLQNWQTAIDMLTKILQLDVADRLGTAALLEIAQSVYTREKPRQAAM